MVYENAIEAINVTIENILEEKGIEDTIPTRIHILRKLKIELDREAADDADLFRIRTLINSELAVLRVRLHITQLDLF